MKERRWLQPELVGQFEYLEWTPDSHLRHSRFVGLRDDDKKPRNVKREGKNAHREQKANMVFCPS